MIKGSQEFHYRSPVAVEGRLLSLLSQEMFPNRGYAVDGNGNMMSAAAVPETVYWSPLAAGFHSVKSDSGLTYAPLSRKRQRESTISPPTPCFPDQIEAKANHGGGAGGVFTFLGEDISSHIHNQMAEMDRFIAQNTEIVMKKIDERRKHYSRKIAATVEEAVAKKLEEKEEEIVKISQLNLALEERLKSLAAENQLWRDLAQSNEAAVNALRSNLEQVLAKAEDDKQRRGEEADLANDAESSCGSTSNGDESGSGSSSSMCRRCRREESCVLLLPCRHLCVCGVCVAAVQNCPLCKSTKTAALHVNRSF